MLELLWILWLWGKDIMKKLFLFLKIALFSLALLTTTYFGGSVTINFLGESMVFHLAAVVLVLGACIYAWGLMNYLLRKIRDFFSEQINYEKGIQSLQRALSGILLKDAPEAEYNIKKAKKHLGDRHIISWLEGQLAIIHKDHHRAKSIFYGLCEHEQQTALGAFSLCKMAMQEKSQLDALNAINAILKISPNSVELIFQAISIALAHRNYAEARKHIPAIRKTKKGRVVEALVYSEEGIHSHNINLVYEAYNLAPELTENSIYYADFLIKEEEYKNAKKVLLHSYQKRPTMELFCKYISCDPQISNLDKIKLAEKAINAVPDSWIGYYGLGEIALQEDLRRVAFDNFAKAYEKKHYDFIAEKVMKSATLQQDPKTPFAMDLLAGNILLETESVEFGWKCQNCGAESIRWTSICRHCDRIAEYEPFERIVNFAKALGSTTEELYLRGVAEKDVCPDRQFLGKKSE